MSDELEKAKKAVESWQLGQTSKQYETGGKGAATISSGKGDKGGVSYGSYQLSTNEGTLREYLDQSRYGQSFKGLSPGTNAFNEKWVELARTDPAFARDQHDFIKKSHVDVQEARLDAKGIDLSDRGRAVQDMLWSTSVQFRKLTPMIVEEGLKEKYGKNYTLASLSDKQIIEAVQDYKINHNDTLFKSSPTLWKGLLNRAHSEKAALLELAGQEQLLKDKGVKVDSPQAGGKEADAPRKPAAPMADGVLERGEKGPEVRALQERLIKAGFTTIEGKPFVADSEYGPRTEAAVREYQRSRGLKIDGEAGPETLNALRDQKPAKTADTPEPARNGVNWPAPGNHTLNKADKPGEGRGEFGTPRGDHRHGGVDIQGKVGDPIESFMPGRVIAVKPNNGDAGNMIVIDHGNGLTSTYMHLDKMYAKVGQKVPEDVEVIGTMGRSGNTPKHGDTHLHFEIHDAKAVTAQNPKGRVDPLPILNGAQQLDGPGAKAEARSDLKLHDKGADVEHLQKRLNDLGYTDAAGKKLATDRDFGNHTREAVEQFQRENGLKATGVADKETLRLVEKGMTRHAAADGQLQPGEKGPDVRGLQENLSQLGLTGTNGKPLKVDGDYGDSTREAVRKFQEAHGLPQSGTADRATLEKLGEQVKFEPKITADGRVTGPITEGGSRTPPADTSQAPPTDRTPPQPPTQADKPSMADPKHPDNAMYRQALTNLEQLGSGAFKSREELERAAAAVTSDARASGLTSIDHVAKTNAASGNQTLLVAVQGDPTSPASKNSYIDYSQAVTQTVDQSSRMAEAAGARQAQQADAPQPEARVAVGAR